VGIIGWTTWETPVAGNEEDKIQTVVYRDANGAIVSRPADAMVGEIVEETDGGRRTRAWFRIQEVELSWLPVPESAFLLWVLAVLAAFWLATGLVLHFT
jgi:hypothetical protein